MQFSMKFNQNIHRFIAYCLNKSNWKSLIAETRSQILLCYIGLMMLFVAAAVPCMYYVLYREVDRVERLEVMEEAQEFRDFLMEQPPENIAQMQQMMVQYLGDDLAEDGQYFIFIVGQTPYAFEPKSLPRVMRTGSPLMETWRMIDRPAQGGWMTYDPQVGKVLYEVEPILISSKLEGLFIVVRTTAEARTEVNQVVRTVLLFMLAILIFAVVIAWLISARILRPLRILSNTARSISESDLTQRIAVSGTGELAELALTFNAMMDRLETAFRSQKAFINDASHELRTPITIIKGHLELIGNDPEEQQEVFELVNDELDRMNRFVRDMLLLTKSERPDFIQPEAVDLEELTNEVYNRAKMVTQCNCELAQVASGTVWLDRQRIIQAMLNLVENSNQHTLKAGRITLGSIRSDQEVRLWVTDTGNGISSEDQQRIFERFARARNQARQSDGAGLGLSIVRAIARASGGRVELESTPGQGATFTIVLPASSSGAISSSTPLR